MGADFLTLHDLSIGYGDRTVISGISAGLERGLLTCLIGDNGAGKSTLLRTLAAFQPPLHGSISIDGRPLADYAPADLARTVGIVLTERLDVEHLTVSELVAMGRAPYTGFWGQLSDDDLAITADAIDSVGIAPLARRQVSTLSDGERQKAIIAKAIAQQTPVILLDEPTAFLDYGSKAATLMLMRRLCRDEQRAVLLSTHDIELALQTADRLWLVTADGSFCCGTPRQLADDGHLKRFIERDSTIHFDPDTLTVRIA